MITQSGRGAADVGRRPAGSGDPVVIRLARDADLPLLHDLAELDSARPLSGAVLVALVDGRPSAALSLDDARAIADPFRATAALVELLALRAKQLRAAGSRPPRTRRRWIAHRPPAGDQGFDLKNTTPGRSVVS